MDKTVVAVLLLSIQHPVFNEDRDGSQDEWHKQVHVDKVPGAVQLPVKATEESSLSITLSELLWITWKTVCIQKDSRAKKNNISYVKNSPLGLELISLQLQLQRAESNQNHFEKGRPKNRPASKWHDEMQFPLQENRSWNGFEPWSNFPSLCYI